MVCHYVADNNVQRYSNNMSFLKVYTYMNINSCKIQLISKYYVVILCTYKRQLKSSSVSFICLWMLSLQGFCITYSNYENRLPTKANLCQRKPVGTGEMTQRSRTFVPLAEDLSLVPSIHTGWLTSTWSSTSQGPNDCGSHEHPHTLANIHSEMHW